MSAFSQAGGLEESAVTGIVVGALLGAGLLMAFYFFRWELFIRFMFLYYLCHFCVQDPLCDFFTFLFYLGSVVVKRCKPFLGCVPGLGGQWVSSVGYESNDFQCDTLQDIGILCSQIPQKQFLPLTNKCRSGEEIDFGGEGGNLLSYSQASHSSGIRVWVHLFRGGITYALRLDVVFRRPMNLTVPMGWSPESCSSNQCTCISSDWSYTPRAGPFLYFLVTGFVTYRSFNSGCVWFLVGTIVLI